MRWKGSAGRLPLCRHCEGAQRPWQSVPLIACTIRERIATSSVRTGFAMTNNGANAFAPKALLDFNCLLPTPQSPQAAPASLSGTPSPKPWGSSLDDIASKREARGCCCFVCSPFLSFFAFHPHPLSGHPIYTKPPQAPEKFSIRRKPLFRRAWKNREILAGVCAAFGAHTDRAKRTKG